MSMKFNGTELSDVYFNGTQLDKVYFNGTLVFERVSIKYKFIWTENTYSLQDVAYTKTDATDTGLVFSGPNANGYFTNPKIENYDYAQLRLTFNFSTETQIAIAFHGSLAYEDSNDDNSKFYVSKLDTQMDYFPWGNSPSTSEYDYVTTYAEADKDTLYIFTVPSGSHFVDVRLSDNGLISANKLYFTVKQATYTGVQTYEELYSIADTPSAIATKSGTGIKILTIEEVEE